MLDMIASRKSNGEREDSHRFDLFSNLLAANEDDFDGQTRLSDRELMGTISSPALYQSIRSNPYVGNVFTFLLAGKHFVHFIGLIALRSSAIIFYSRARGKYSFITSSEWDTDETFQTTAQTLCFAFGLLALHQDFQERLYQHIQSIIPSGRTPVCST